MLRAYSEGDTQCSRIIRVARGTGVGEGLFRKSWPSPAVCEEVTLSVRVDAGDGTGRRGSKDSSGARARRMTSGRGADHARSGVVTWRLMRRPVTVQRKAWTEAVVGAPGSDDAGGVDGFRWLTTRSVGVDFEVEVGWGAACVAGVADVADDRAGSDVAGGLSEAFEVGSVVVGVVVAPESEGAAAESGVGVFELA